MKILFLDFDGVLNSEKYLRTTGAFGVAINKEKLILLKRIIDETSARIVLTTSWRSQWSDSKDNLINNIFNEAGLKIFDKTPELSSRREEEIKQYLENCSDVEAYVILDDMMLGGDFLKNHFVKTSAFRDGLDTENANEAIKILNR